MAEQIPDAEDDGARFDVVVRKPSGLTLEELERRAAAAGIRPDRIASLVKALKDVPQVKIGAAVPRARAEAARDQFSQTGLTVEINSVLALQSLTTGSFDAMSVCPACKKRVTLSPQRQCPECGVFVDKVTDDFLLRKKIMEQEKAKLDFQTQRDVKESDKRNKAAMEAAIREEIRKELEAKYGRAKGSRSGAAVKLAGVTALLLVAFVGGRGSLSGFSWEQMKNGGGMSSANAATGPGGAAGAAGGPGGAGGGVAATGDPDIDDPLVQAAGGKRIGAKGISIEQAVAAAQTLGKSVGHAGPGLTAGGGGAAGAAAGAAGAAVGADGAPSAGAAVPEQVKGQLALEFVRQLAEMGQLPRAREMIKALRASPRFSGNPALAAAAQATDIEVRAWLVQAGGRGADALLSEASEMKDPAARSRALARAAVVLGKLQMPGDMTRKFLQQAGEAAKSVAEPQRPAALGEWAVAQGEVLLAQAEASARAGTWTKWHAVNAQIDTLAGQAPEDLSRARLAAIDHQIKLYAGQQTRAGQRLDEAMQGLGQAATLAERAALLRSLSALSGPAAQPKIAAAAGTLLSQALAKSGVERAQTLMELALMQAEAGHGGKASELLQAAQATPGLAGAGAAGLGAELIARGDMANARVLHGAGQYAEAEEVLQRLGSYLL